MGEGEGEGGGGGRGVDKWNKEMEGQEIGLPQKREAGQRLTSAHGFAEFFVSKLTRRA